jgi:threonine/homoserine/homoserine lactone efflux protein
LARRALLSPENRDRQRVSGESSSRPGRPNVLNPKVALFFLAFLPQFVSPHAGISAVGQMLILGAVFALLGLLFLTFVAYFSGSLGEGLGGNPRFAQALRWFSGSVLVGLGLRLALPEHR